MKAADVRRSVSSSSSPSAATRSCTRRALVPANDPTLLFTNAGMNQFKDVFTGARDARPYKRATTSQKCVRAGGKHNDLDEVGKTPRHHTFFEMLGNFSFGDYFKDDAIAWAWELLTERLRHRSRRGWCHRLRRRQGAAGVGADDEARAIWKQVTGFGDDRDHRPRQEGQLLDDGRHRPDGAVHRDPLLHATATADRVADRRIPASVEGLARDLEPRVHAVRAAQVAGGPLDPLPAPSIDTGAGPRARDLRSSRACARTTTPICSPPLIAQARRARGQDDTARDPTSDTSMRVIADHARASAFLIADGVFPDKTGREYVLRRIFRRAVRHGKLLGIKRAVHARGVRRGRST